MGTWGWWQFWEMAQHIGWFLNLSNCQILMSQATSCDTYLLPQDGSTIQGCFAFHPSKEDVFPTLSLLHLVRLTSCLQYFFCAIRVAGWCCFYTYIYIIIIASCQELWPCVASLIYKVSLPWKGDGQLEMTSSEGKSYFPPRVGLEAGKEIEFKKKGRGGVWDRKRPTWSSKQPRLSFQKPAFSLVLRSLRMGRGDHLKTRRRWSRLRSWWKAMLQFLDDSATKATFSG